MRAAADVAGVATRVTIATVPPARAPGGVVQEGELRAEIEAVDAASEHDPAERVARHQAEMVQHLGFAHLEPGDPGLVREGGPGLDPVGIGAPLDDRLQEAAGLALPDQHPSSPVGKDVADRRAPLGVVVDRAGGLERLPGPHRRSRQRGLDRLHPAAEESDRARDRRGEGGDLGRRWFP